jgi:SAM-dependent methyltransferase
MRTMNTAANIEQALRWNGEGGEHWIAHRERHEELRRDLIPRLLAAAAAGPGDQVLDVGCGCGETTIALARAVGPGGGALGLDLSAPMLAVARGLAAEAGLANVQFVQADAQIHPLPPARYDVVLSSFGVMFFNDPAAALGNILGALRPGGRLTFLCWQGAGSNELFGLPQAAVEQHTVAEPAGDEPFTDPGQIAALLTGAGATGITVEPVAGTARLGADVADVLGYVRGMGRYRRLFAELDDDLAGRILGTLAERYAARQRGDGIWIDLAAWLVRAARDPRG